MSFAADPNADAPSVDSDAPTSLPVITDRDRDLTRERARARLFAARGEPDTVRALLEKGVDPNALEALMHLWALHKAAYSGSASVATALLQAGAAVDLQASSG